MPTVQEMIERAEAEEADTPVVETLVGIDSRGAC